MSVLSVYTLKLEKMVKEPYILKVLLIHSDVSGNNT